MSEELLLRLNELSTGGIHPDRTYLLDVDVETGVQRAGARGQSQGRDRIERELPSFFESVRKRYLEVAKKDHERILLLRGTDPIQDLRRQILDDALSLLRSLDLHPSR